MITGLHHITAITNNVQNNYHFYNTVLGLRFVKQTINQDDVTSYHLYYANETASPGSSITFFGWNLKKGKIGAGEVYNIEFNIPINSLKYWSERLQKYSVSYRKEKNKLIIQDRDGLKLTLTESSENNWPEFKQSEILPNKQINGLKGVDVTTKNLEMTKQVLQLIGKAEIENNEVNLPNRQKITLIETQNTKLQGAGSVHHLAFNVETEKEQIELMQKLQKNNIPTSEVIDRLYFKSVYFQEPGGNLFEIATKNPGYTIDEAENKLGSTLKLPPWLEQHRQQIESGLPPLKSKK